MQYIVTIMAGNKTVKEITCDYMMEVDKEIKLAVDSGTAHTVVIKFLRPKF